MNAIHTDKKQRKEEKYIGMKMKMRREVKNHILKKWKGEMEQDHKSESLVNYLKHILICMFLRTKCSHSSSRSHSFAGWICNVATVLSVRLSSSFVAVVAFHFSPRCLRILTHLIAVNQAKIDIFMAATTSCCPLFTLVSFQFSMVLILQAGQLSLKPNTQTQTHSTQQPDFCRQNVQQTHLQIETYSNVEWRFRVISVIL